MRKGKTILPYSADYRYWVSSISEYNCDLGCQPYCRCGTIVSIECDREFNSFAVLSYELKNIESYIGRKLSDIELYVVERYLSQKIRDVDSLEWISQNGYYGEELDSVKLKNPDELLKDTLMLLNLPSDKDKVFAVLTLEYGTIADTIKDITSVEIRKIDVEDIVMPSITQYNFVSNNDNIYEDIMFLSSTKINATKVGRKKIYTSTVTYNYQYELPVAVCKQNPDSSLSIVDGYHRISALKKLLTEKQEVDVVVLL